MKNVLIIGAGRSATSLIKYLLDHSKEHGWLIMVADAEPALAESKVNKHPNGLAVWLDASKPNDRKDLIRRADLVISLLPPHLHVPVAIDCIQLRKHLLTTSYLIPELQDLHETAKESGLTFIAEIGFDPGLDHISVMPLIRKLQADGSKIEGLRSYSGALIAPESDDNPWHYKFTWNPQNVINAGKGISQYLVDKQNKYIRYDWLFRRTRKVEVPSIGMLEMYLNRDALVYRKPYGVEKVPNILRGTLRYPGFCAGWDAIIRLGLTDDNYPIMESYQMPYKKLIEAFLEDSKGRLKDRVARYLGEDPSSPVMKKLSWLGLFGNKKIKLQHATPAAILKDLLLEKFALNPNDQDLVVLQHECDFISNGKKKTLVSSLVHKGSAKDGTAMSKAVGLPIGIIAKLVINGTFSDPGVHLPVHPDLYKPVLQELAEAGLEFVETEREYSEFVL